MRGVIGLHEVRFFQKIQSEGTDEAYVSCSPGFCAELARSAGERIKITFRDEIGVTSTLTPTNTIQAPVDAFTFSVQPVIDAITSAVQTGIDAVPCAVQAMVDAIPFTIQTVGPCLIAVGTGPIRPAIQAIVDTITSTV